MENIKPKFSELSILDKDRCLDVWNYVLARTMKVKHLKKGTREEKDIAIEYLKFDCLSLSLIPTLCKYVDKMKKINGQRKREKVILFYKYIVTECLDKEIEQNDESLEEIITLVVESRGFHYKQNAKKMLVIKEIASLLVILGKLFIPFLKFF